MKTSEVLNLSADEIERRGWATGNCGMKTTGPTCLEGAIAAVLGTPTAIYASPKGAPNDLERGDLFYDYRPELHLSPAYVAVLDYLDRKQSLYVWNDNQTGPEPVIEALRAAAVIAAARESATQPAPVAVS